MVWFRFIDDIFLIWTGNKESLNHFISLTQSYYKSKTMKYKVKFKILKITLSTNGVLFLDATVSLKHEKLRTALLFTKPADSHFCVIPSLHLHPIF